jgi:hypothetical protein
MSVKLSKYFILLMFFIILFTIFYTGIYYSRGDNSILQNAFFRSGAEFVNSEVYVWSDIDKEIQESENLLDLADQLAIDLNVTEKDVLSKQTDKAIEIKGTSDDGKIVSIITKQSNDNGQKGNVSINVINRVAGQDINDTASVIKEKFKKFKLKPKVNTCIVGCFDGKLDYGEMNRISKSILKDAKAKKIDSISDNNLISISAYSPYIENDIEVYGKKINMNLALRYNAFENKTYIWLATPVITIEY